MRASLLRELRILLRPIETRIANAIARAVVERVDDSKTLQSLQLGVLDGEPVEDAERFQPYGMTSKPTAGAEAVVVFPDGDRSHPLVIAVDDRRYRLTGLADGEVALYSEHGQTVLLKADGSVQVNAASVLVDADDVRIDADNTVEVVGTSVLLGADTAIDGVIKGTQRNTAEQTFLSAFATFVGAITGVPPAPKATFQAALAVFQTSLPATISTVVKTV